MSGAAVPASPDAPLVVFDFDHTLYDGDSGLHLIRWLITRSWWRSLLAIAAAPLLLPLLAFLATRRAGVSGYLWLGTAGPRRRRDRADLPLLRSAAHPVVVNPKRASVDLFRRALPAGTPILHWGCAGRGGAPVAAAA